MRLSSQEQLGELMKTPAACFFIIIFIHLCFFFLSKNTLLHQMCDFMVFVLRRSRASHHGQHGPEGGYLATSTLPYSSAI